ncbi:hypothetical protein [Bradyrhizobium sp. 5.13L]
MLKRLAGRRQFGNAVRDEATIRPFESLARTKRTWPAISVVLEAWPYVADVKIAALGNAKSKKEALIDAAARELVRSRRFH